MKIKKYGIGLLTAALTITSMVPAFAAESDTEAKTPLQNMTESLKKKSAEVQDDTKNPSDNNGKMEYVMTVRSDSNALPEGMNPEDCEIIENADGTFTIKYKDGSEVIVSVGDKENMNIENEDGAATIFMTKADDNTLLNGVNPEDYEIIENADGTFTIKDKNGNAVGEFESISNKSELAK